MNQSEKIEYLLKCVDAMRIQIELLNTKQSTMNYMILDVAKEKLSKEWPEIYSRYVDTLEQASDYCLKNLKEMMYDSSNPLLVQNQFSIFQNIQSMKRDPSYHQQKSDEKE